MSLGDNSVYPHERDALNQIEELLRNVSSQISLYGNLEFPDNKNIFLECDLILVCNSGIFIIELKNWYGRIEIHNDFWQREYDEIISPHKLNISKCKNLMNYLKKKQPTIHLPIVRSILVLTNEEAEIHGADEPDMASTNCHENKAFTFDGVTNFAKYIRRFIKDNDSQQVSNSTGIVNHWLKKLNEEHQFSKQIPGFTIVEERSVNSLWSEFLARPESIYDNSIRKLRVYGNISQDPSEKEKQLRGINTLKKIGPHPNILSVQDYPNEKKILIEVSLWSDSGTLRDFLKREKKEHRKGLKFSEALRISLDIARALTHIHNNENIIIHRDLRPENILISGNRAQLMNFDLSYNADSSFTVMSDEDKKATSPYKAPEVYNGKEDTASDIFSFGVILYELLKGNTPFKSSNEMLGNHVCNLNITPQEIRECKDEERLEVIIRLIKKCLSPNIKERPDAETLIKVLEEDNSDKKTMKKRINYENRVLETGTSYNTYEIVGLLGKGATAQVYEALNTEDPVMLKLFNIDTPMEMFLNEKNMLQKIDSPYVIRHKSQGQWEDERFYIEQEYFQGKTLFDMINEGVRPNINAFKTVTEHLLTALSELHKDSNEDEDKDENEDVIIHNDINPRNILINDKLALKVIDLGVASPPGRGKYCGTPGYIPLDLIAGDEKIYSPQVDLFGAGISLLEWLTGENPYKSDNPFDKSLDNIKNLPDNLKEWFVRGISLCADERFKSATEMLTFFSEIFEAKEEIITDPVVPVKPIQEPIFIAETEDEDYGGDLEETSVGKSGLESPSYKVGSECLRILNAGPNFVDYLNSLHNVTPDNENALAESQAVSDEFGKICVRHNDIHDKIISILKGEDFSDDSVIVLTGHAGDGKSTIALEILKELLGISRKNRLPNAPEKEEKVVVNNREITILKDMSELSSDERHKILERALKNSGSWLLVSNTGPFLETFSEIAAYNNKNRDDMENKILESLSSEIEHINNEKHWIRDFEKPVLVVNLANFDNEFIAEGILNKIIDHNFWKECGNCRHKNFCPVLTNINALKIFPDAINRILMLHRRITGYGKRLTARQLSAHIAFSLTAGLNCRDVAANATSFDREKFRSDYLLSNSIFGDVPGSAGQADNLFVVRCLSPLQMGSKPFVQLERKLFSEDSFKSPGIVESPDYLNDLFIYLLKYASSNKSNESGRARQRLRRFIYFFGFGDSPNEGNEYTDFFLMSPMLRKSQELLSGQTKTDNISLVQWKYLALKVLTEEYTGFCVSQYSNLNDVYITLKREIDDIPQNFQIVTAKIPFDLFELDINQRNKRIEITALKGRRAETLILPLPLLDYIYMKSQGELSSQLDASNKNAIDRFKSQLEFMFRKNDGIINIMGAQLDGRIILGELEINSQDNLRVIWR